MPWEIVERKLGRAGPLSSQRKRQSEWNRKYGEDWMIGYVWEDEFISREEAIEVIYNASYAAHFQSHPEDLTELLSTAKVLRNPHAIATGGVDLQVPAIKEYLIAIKEIGAIKLCISIYSF